MQTDFTTIRLWVSCNKISNEVGIIPKKKISKKNAKLFLRMFDILFKKLVIRCIYVFFLRSSP